MKITKRIIIACLSTCIILGSILGYEFFNHKKSVEWGEDTFNYFAIGNSITYHDVCEYWWNEGVGMAASDAEHDYVRLVESYLKEIKGDTIMHNMNFFIWEKQSYDRAETLHELDRFLSNAVDLVTIQLGENVIDTNTLELDFIELIHYIEERCSNVQIIIVGQFWRDEKKDAIKKSISEKCNVAFADLSGIEENIEEYVAGMGTTVYDGDGKKHIIEHSGVAEHPGDKGMAYIAEAIEQHIK